MDANLRRRLDDLLEQLHLHRGQEPGGEPAVSGAQGAVQEAIDTESASGLGSRLEEYAVELETSHPTIGTMLRSLVDELSAMGI